MRATILIFSSSYAIFPRETGDRNLHNVEKKNVEDIFDVIFENAHLHRTSPSVKCTRIALACFENIHRYNDIFSFNIHQ